MFSWIPYILALTVIIGGAIDLYLDREKYKTKRLKRSAVVIFILIGVLTFFSLYKENKEKEDAKRDADGNIAELKGKMDAATRAENTAIQDQKNNTERFTRLFKELSEEVAGLKAQVRTEALQKKLDRVQAELVNTQKAMTPEKATLSFSFFPFENPPLTDPPAKINPVTNIKVPAAADGSVHVEFVVLNLTTVDALDVAVSILIPDACRFAKDPKGFIRLPREPDSHRFIELPRVHAWEVYAPIAVDIIVPPKMSSFVIAMVYRCRTCVLSREPPHGTVQVLRDFLRPTTAVPVRPGVAR